MKELNFDLKVASDLPNYRQFAIHILLLQSFVKTNLLQVLKPYGLSLEQFNVLRILRGQQGEALNLRDIQERMISKMSNTTRLIDKLISKGFVNRIQCPENRRKIEVNITNKGLKQLEVLDPLIDRAENSIVANLNQVELKQLNHLLSKIGAQTPD